MLPWCSVQLAQLYKAALSHKSAMKVSQPHVTDKDAVACMRGSNSGLHGSKATRSAHEKLTDWEGTHVVHACMWARLYKSILTTGHRRAYGGRLRRGGSWSWSRKWWHSVRQEQGASTNKDPNLANRSRAEPQPLNSLESRAGRTNSRQGGT